MTFPKHAPSTGTGESFSDVIQTEDIELEIASIQNPPEGYIRRQQSRTAIHVFDRIFHSPPNNYLALKLYGRILPANPHKQILQPGDSKWMIHPYSNFKIIWDVVIVFVLLLTIIVLPVGLAFYSDDQLEPQWLVPNILVDFIFALDIIIIFRTIQISKRVRDKIILNPRKVAKAYLSSWLFIDVISTIPFDYLGYAAIGEEERNATITFSQESISVWVIRLLGLLRLLRISKLIRFARIWETFFDIGGGFLRIVKLVVLMTMLSHWNGCLQFLIPYLQGIPEDSWIAINSLQNVTVSEQYSWAVFKATAHMLGIGFGRFPPQNVTEVWLTMISMIIGATFYALFIGSISTLVLSTDSSGRLYDEKLNQVEQYMRYRKIPKNIKTKVYEYYEYRYGRKLFDEQGILNDLSKGLKEVIISHNYKQLIQNTPLFQHSEESFVMAVLTRLNIEVFLKNEIIIQAGTKGDRMYFVACGRVAIMADDDTVLNTLEAGSYFGEICLLTDERRSATAKALTPCDLCTLTKQDFLELMEEYPNVESMFQTVAAVRLSKIGKDGTSTLLANLSGKRTSSGIRDVISPFPSFTRGSVLLPSSTAFTGTEAETSAPPTHNVDIKISQET